MTDSCGSSSQALGLMNEKTVLVRVKRKAFQSRLDAFWLEINERPLKRQLLDFGKLSISGSSLKEESRCKRVFVQHVETVKDSVATFDILQSKELLFADEIESNARNVERRPLKNESQKQNQLLSKAREKQEVLAKNARFEQIWRSRKQNKEAVHGKSLDEKWDVYDVVRVDAKEKSEEKHDQEEMSLEDQMVLRQFLPLMKEHLPGAAAAIESDIRAYMSYQTSADDYVYDLYTVRSNKTIVEEDPLNPFPLVEVDDNDDDFYDGPPESDYDSEDSNAENNLQNDYPDETSEDDAEMKSSNASDDEAESENESSVTSTEPKGSVSSDRLDDACLLFEDVDEYDSDFTCDYDYDHDDDFV